VWPLATMSFPKGLAFALVPYLLHGLIFYVFSQVSHAVEEAQGEVHKQWAVHQVSKEAFIIRCTVVLAFFD
jgi:hypothetical protein